jgi:hypothetical protein
MHPPFNMGARSFHMHTAPSMGRLSFDAAGFLYTGDYPSPQQQLADDASMEDQASDFLFDLGCGVCYG